MLRNVEITLTDICDTYSLRQWPIFCEYDEQMLRKRRKFRLSFTCGLYVANRIKITFTWRL